MNEVISKSLIQRNDWFTIGISNEIVISQSCLPQISMIPNFSIDSECNFTTMIIKWLCTIQRINNGKTFMAKDVNNQITIWIFIFLDTDSWYKETRIKLNYPYWIKLNKWFTEVKLFFKVQSTNVTPKGYTTAVANDLLAKQPPMNDN